MTFAWPRFVTKMLAGLMSRWTMPFACAASSASAICDAQVQEDLGLERLAADEVLEGLAFEQLHDDEVLALVLADVVDRADVGVVQGRRGPRLAPEALDGARVLRRSPGAGT